MANVTNELVYSSGESLLGLSPNDALEQLKSEIPEYFNPEYLAPDRVEDRALIEERIKILLLLSGYPEVFLDRDMHFLDPYSNPRTITKSVLGHSCVFEPEDYLNSLKLVQDIAVARPLDLATSDLVEQVRKYQAIAKTKEFKGLAYVSGVNMYGELLIALPERELIVSLTDFENENFENNDHGFPGNDEKFDYLSVLQLSPQRAINALRS